MEKSNHLFVLRQIRNLVDRGVPPREVLEKVLPLGVPGSEVDRALAAFDRSGSLVASLVSIGLVELEPRILEILQAHEKETGRVILVGDLLDSKRSASHVFQVMKSRLRVGLGYAFWLLIIANIVFYIVTNLVLPGFQEYFTSFGAALPPLTRLALDWHDALFSPFVLSLVFTAFVFFLLVSLRQLPLERKHNRFFSRMPFLRSIYRYVDSVNWLAQIGVLVNAGLSAEQAFKVSGSPPPRLARLVPGAVVSIERADLLQGAPEEAAYQLAQLEVRAEAIAVNASRNFVAVVMSLVVAFVVFVLVASYLPIFHLASGV